MFNVSKEFNQEINKLQGRKFNAKVIIRDKEFSGSLIYEMSLEESVNPSDSFSIGTVCSNNFEIKLINTGDVFENAVVKPYVGLYIGEKVEYVPLGVFNVVKSNINGKFINLECVDNMLKLEGGYFSDLSYPADINDIAKEICKKVGINLASKLPNYRVNKIEGYSLREAIGFIASLCGSFARFNRIGDLEIKGYETVKQEMTPNNLFKLDIDADECIIRKIIAQKGEEELSIGIDEGNKIIFDNPVITKEILNDIYSKYDGFKYIPYTAKWKGNPAIMAGDVLGLTDTKGNKYNALIMEQKFVYKNGISSEVKAKGKSKQESNFDSKGSMTKIMERYSIEQASIKKALIDKANINDLTVVNAKIERLYTEDLTAIRADIVTLNSQKATITELNAVKADLQQAIINKANITDLNAAVGKINVLESKTGNIENLLAGNLTADNFKANSITANSGIIAEGAIGDAQIGSVSANKMRTGTLDTGVVTVAGPNGRLKILGNKLQIFDDVNNRLFERIMLGINDKNRASLTLRGADGQTVLLTEEGLTKAGITDGFNKADDNSLNALKIDKNSIVRQVNGATETIAGTRIQVGDRTLDVELSTQKNTITEHGKELSTQKASIQALDNAIKLKVDTQTFTQSTTTINNNINRAKEEAINESRSILDTRKDNQNPEWYMSNYPRKTISEFKYANVIGIPNAKANYGVLETKIPWDNPSGGYPTQVFRGNNYPTYQRKGINNTSWGEWEQIEDTQGSQDKANSALNNAKEYTNSEITTVNTHLNKATTEINLLKGEINLKVNQTDIDKTIKTIEDKIKLTTEKITTVESTLTQKTNSIEAGVRDLNSTTQNITTNVSNINRDLTSKINSNLDVAKSFATDIATIKANTAKQEAINSANSHADSIATGKATEALNNAKAYTNVQINTVNTKVHNMESNITILTNKINSKVSQSDIDKSISTIQIGGRNLAQLTTPKEYSAFTGKENDCQMSYATLLDTLNVGDSVTISFIFSYENLITVPGRNDYFIRLQGSGDVVGWNDGAFPSIDITDRIQWGDGHSGSFKVIYTSKITTNVKKNTKWNSNFRMDCIQSGKVSVKEFMVEYGTKSTAYVQAPEDVDKVINDSIKIVDSKISDVSSNVTQLKDSVTTQINSINSKTQSIETTLGGKASKQEVTDVNNKVTTIKASLDGITQRVSTTESKTHTLESNLNGKANKQEIVDLNSKVVDITANLNGITQKVSATETLTKTLNDKLWETTNKLNHVEQQITPTAIINTVSSSYYKKGEVDNVFSTKSQVEQLDNRINYRFSNTGYSNLIFNGNFANGTVHWKNWGNCSLVAENGQLLVRAKQSSEKANMGAVSSTFVLEKGKKYSLSFQGASCWNIPWLNYIYLLGEDGVNYRLDLNFNINSADLVYRTATFTAPATKWVRLLIGIEGYLQTDVSGFKLVDVCLVEGDIPRRFIPNANEISEGSTSIDSNGVIVRHSNDSYTSMTHGGFEWKTKGMSKAYHCLAETGWINISTGAWLGDHYDIKITLPEYFKGKVFTPCSMIQGWYVESNFSLNQLVVNIPYETINYSEGSFVIRVKALTRDGVFQRNINISWLAIA